MTEWICATCAVEYPDTDQPPPGCPICSDERQYVRPSGQRWTTLAELEAAGHRGRLTEIEPGLLGVDIAPSVGIGQRALLVQTPGGNLLWDPTGYVDDDLAAQVTAVGGVAVIAASHPHMFGVQVEWSHRYGGAPVYVADHQASDGPVCVQVKYNLIDRAAERELAPACVQFGLSIVPFGPLHGGLLAGTTQVEEREFAGDKRFGGSGFSETEFEVGRGVERLSQDWSLQPYQVSLAWLLSRPAVASVIVGAETVEEITANATAANVKLEQAQLDALTALRAGDDDS